MKKYQDSQTQNSPLAGIINQITAVIDVERIYVHFPEKAGISQTVLTILAADGSARPTAELLPLVSAIFDGTKTFHFTLHAADQVADSVSKGNLYFCSICCDEQLVYAKKGPDYTLPPAPADTRQRLDEARRVYELESVKVDSFMEGAGFYFDQQNYNQSAFMLHQAIELNYRAFEQFLTGKSKVTHSIKAHQKFVESYYTGLNNIFSEDSISDVEHLKLLDDAYLAVRYENNYQISKSQVLALKAKASEVKTAALNTLLMIIQMPGSDTAAARALEAAEQIGPVAGSLQVPVSITALIRSSFDVHRIYCFGKRTYRHSRYSCFNGQEDGQTAKVHFDLLVIATGDPGKDTADLQSRINSNTGNLYTVLILGCSPETFSRSLDENNRFFHTVLTSAELVFDNGEVASEQMPKQYDRTRMVLDCKIQWNQRYDRANAFIAATDAPFEQGEQEIVLSLISQGVEQICLGLIAVFLGYKPGSYSLSHLFDLCSNFTPLVRDIFPAQNKLDKDLFKILSKGARSPRYLTKLSLDPTDTGVLYQRFQLLIEQSEQLVEEHIEKMEQNSK